MVRSERWESVVGGEERVQKESGAERKVLRME